MFVLFRFNTPHPPDRIGFLSAQSRPRIIAIISSYICRGGGLITWRVVVLWVQGCLRMERTCPWHCVASTKVMFLFYYVNSFLDQN
jgi:hypothetical protein